MRQVNIQQASEQELRDFGRSYLGLALPPNCKVETLRAKISEAWDKPYIVIADAEEDGPQIGDEPVPVEEGQVGPGRDMVRIHISITEDAGGSEDVPVGVNGKVMLIPRGKDVDIPVEYHEALQHAITHKYEPLPDGQGINPIPRKVPLYPHQVISRFRKDAA